MGAALRLGSQGLGDLWLYADPGPQIPASNFKVYLFLSGEVDTAQPASGMTPDLLCCGSLARSVSSAFQCFREASVIAGVRTCPSTAGLSRTGDSFR